MTDPYYVLVAGSGNTSRANVEALMDDHYYANGANGTLVLSFIGKPSQGQIYAGQFAKDKNKEIVIFCPDESETNAITNTAKVIRTSVPLEESLKLISSQNSSAFILWNDEDEASLEILNGCVTKKIPCFNLTDGLLALNAVDASAKPVAPIMPEIEQVTSDTQVVEEDDYEEPEDEDVEEEDEEEFEETEDVLYAAIYEISKMIAESILVQLKDKITLKETK